jgi:hypothetical protein
MLVRVVASVVVCLATVLFGLPGPASATGGPGDGVPVSHDREVKRDKAGDVKGDGSTPIDIRRVQYDHYQTGSKGRLVITVRFASRVRTGSEVTFGTSTGAGGHSIELKATAGGKVRLERDNNVVRKPGIRRAIDGREWQITVPWGKLGSPDKLVGLHFWAELWKIPEWVGIDQAFKNRAVLK